jgi:hypothetical protein
MEDPGAGGSSRSCPVQGEQRRPPVRDGGPPGQLRQHTTVRPRTIGDASAVSHGNPPTSSTQRAVVGTGKRKLVASLERGAWVDHRQAYETREVVQDQGADFYRQEWIDSVT